MAAIEDFILRFKTSGVEQVNKASEAVKTLSNDVTEFGQSAGVFGNSLDTIVGKLGPVGGAIAAVGGAIVALGIKAVNIADEFGDISAATGITASQLMSFKASVIDAGGKAEDFANLATKLNQGLQEAAGGNEKLQKSFQSLGIYVTDSAGNIRSTGDILTELTLKLQQGSVSGEQYNAVIDLLGKTAAKLDLTKLQTINDPFRNEEIEQLGRYSAAYDTFMTKVEERLVTYTAKMLDFLDLNRRMMSDAELAQQGLKRLPQTFWSGEKIVEMTPAEKAAYAARVEAEKKARQAELEASTPKNGTYGKTPESIIKEREREAERLAREAKRREEAYAKEIKALNDLTSAYDRNNQKSLDKIQLDRELITATENQKEMRRALAEVDTQYADQMLKLQNSLNDLELRKQQGDENAIRLMPKVKEELDKLTDAYNNQKDSVMQLIEAKQADAAANRLSEFMKADFEKTREQLRGIKQELWDVRSGLDPNISKQWLEATRAVEEYAKSEAKVGNVISAEQFNSLVQEHIDNVKKIQAAQKELDKEREKFTVGWSQAMKDYVDNVNNGARRAQEIFQNMTMGMEDMLVNFFKTGKLEWKDFLQSIVDQLLRSQIQGLIAKTFGGIGSAAKSGGGNIISSIGSLLGFASGGVIPTNGPVLVGERGPEILSGAGGRVVTPNDQIGGGGNITYNINAVDAASFKQMIARDPAFLYAVTEQGRRKIPGG